MRITFEIVKVKATRRWVEDGKQRQETRAFWQSMNPFNKDAKGRVKSRDAIMREILVARNAWLRSVAKLKARP